MMRKAAADAGDTGSAPAWMTLLARLNGFFLVRPIPDCRAGGAMVEDIESPYRRLSPSVSVNPTDTPSKLTTSVEIVRCTSASQS